MKPHLGAATGRVPDSRAPFRVVFLPNVGSRGDLSQTGRRGDSNAEAWLPSSHPLLGIPYLSCGVWYKHSPIVCRGHTSAPGLDSSM